MAKEWFQHDYGTRNKKKLAAFIHEEGCRGYGLFWIIVEMLYEDRNKKMDLDDYTYLAIKKESGEDVKFVQEFIKRCIEVYKVFKKIGKRSFSTERVLENDKHRREISRKNSENGIKSAKSKRKRGTPVERPLNDAQQSVEIFQQRRGEESRVEEIIEEERESIQVEEQNPVVEPPPQIQPPHPLLNSNLFKKPTIPIREDVSRVFLSAGGTEEMAESFWKKYDATGWFINGSAIQNYVSLAQRFITNWKANEIKNGPKEVPSHMKSSGGPKLEKL